MPAGEPDLRHVALTVADGLAGTRLDAYVAGALPDLGRNQAKRLILQGRVTINGANIVEPKRAVKPGDQVTVDVPPAEPAAPEPEPIPLNIVFEDEHLIVIDKPAGLVVHPAAGNRAGTLVNALLAHCGNRLSGIGGFARPGIVHRLDKDTTGLMVVAKTDRAHRGLAAQFADRGATRTLERAYQALVWGTPPQIKGTVDLPLGRSTRNREKIEVKRSGGRRAITHYRVIETYAKPPLATLVECRLETGRTHQIRVHMAAIGHPIVGDRTYGRGFATKATLLPAEAQRQVAAFPRQALHAGLLGFTHPASGNPMRFRAPLPSDMRNLLSAFKSL